MKFNFHGLSESAVLESRRVHGSNAVTPQKTETFWDKLLENVKDPIIIILIVALVITLFLAIFGYTHWYEGVGIAVAVVIATLVATWSEYSNETAFQKLLAEASRIQVKVFRDGRLVEIAIDELVVGDEVLLQPGDTIPSDGVLVAGHLEVNQAALTGESEALKKHALPNENTPIDPEHHGVMRASLVEDGEAVMRVTAVGDKTTYGQTLNELISAEGRLSPLQEKLAVLGQHISQFGYIGAVLVALAFIANRIYFPESDAVAAGFAGYWAANTMGQIISHIVTALILSIIIIVVAVPEGLPMMIAFVLSLNMRKLLDAKVLVRKLLGIETAGSLTVLFTDKTGTLTQGQLTVAEVVTGDTQHYPKLEGAPAPLADLLAFALRNNTSAIIDASNPEHPGIVGADRTEQALLRFLGPQLIIKDDLEVIELIPFSSSRKFSASQVQGTRNLTLVKGAPEIVLKNCTHFVNNQGERVPLDEPAMMAIQAEMDGLSERAMRLIAVAVTETPITPEQTLPDQLALVGIFGLRDNLRTESYAAVKRAKQAGIHVTMITGDSKETAQAIAKEVGLLEDDPDAQVITSSILATLSDDEVKQMLPHLYVVARAFPTDKSRLVKLAKELGWVVGMTGDGVNDAPAVKNADVGFAMGSGTEMTKESSDIVILDDNFHSLTQAVLYGRTLFKSIRKFLVFQLTVNFSAILVTLLGTFFASYMNLRYAGQAVLPLEMVQLLWINIIIDTLAGLAFAGEPALTRYMQEKPIPKDAPLITQAMAIAILVGALSATVLCIIFLMFLPGLFMRPGLSADENQLVFLTAFFCFFVFVHVINQFNVRAEGFNLFEHITENKNFLAVISVIVILQVFFTYVGGDVLRTVGLLPHEWLYVIGFAALMIPIDLTRKALSRRFLNHCAETAPPTAA